MNKKRVIWLVILSVLTLATVGFIWGNSMLDKTSSGQESGAVYNFLKPFFEFFERLFNVKFYDHNFMRKLAHFGEFFILGIEVTFIFVTVKFYNWKSYLIILGTTLAVAGIDEIIQIFTNRGPSILDVLIDFSGAFISSSIIFLISLGIKRRKRKKAEKENINGK